MTENPNILWITVESLRFDHTSLSDYFRETTPEMARIAGHSSSTSFSQCISPAKWTAPSTASILTGTYPVRHGVGLTNDTLPDEMTTVPDLLNDVGYETRGVSPNGYSGPASNLDRDFDEYIWLNKSSLVEDVGLLNVLQYGLHLREHTGGFTMNTERHPTSYFSNKVLERWISELEDTNRPYFLYSHYQDPHHAYVPPLNYISKFLSNIDVSTDEAVDIALEMAENLHEVMATEDYFSPREWKVLAAMYDATIYYTDKCIGELYDYFVRRSSRDTIVVITGDHGDLFGEYGLVSHKLVLHDGLIHVPMITENLPEVNKEADAPVQTIDVMQTLLNHVGTDTSQFQGVDIRNERREFAVSQRGRRAANLNMDKLKEKNPEFDDSQFHLTLLHSLRTSDWKYLQSEHESELHKLPDDISDVSADHPEIETDLATKLESWIETHSTPFETATDSHEMTEELKDHLSDMGYIVD